MAKYHQLDELTGEEREQLKLLKQVFALVQEHQTNLSRNAATNTNPIHALVELVQLKQLEKTTFEKLLGKGSFSRWVLGRETPGDTAALHHLRHLKKLMRQEMWREVEEGKRTHPLDVSRARK